eukprot:1899010-Pyramimonas_sp.AAC.1
MRHEDAEVLLQLRLQHGVPRGPPRPGRVSSADAPAPGPGLAAGLVPLAEAVNLSPEALFGLPPVR